MSIPKVMVMMMMHMRVMTLPKAGLRDLPSPVDFLPEPGLQLGAP